MKIVTKALGIIFLFLFPVSITYSQCSVCTLTNPASLPDPIPAGVTVCITVNKTYGGGANLTGGIINICSGAELKINGAVDISSTSAIRITGCSKLEVNGNIENDNPDGLVILDNCNCATAIDVSGPIFGFGVICGPLPVELLSFDANLQGQNKVDLNWSTASETNNDHFIIERSTDAINWNEITRVTGAGNSNEVKYYNSQDVVSETGVYYYRLVQVDYNGDKEVFDSRSVNVTNIETSVQLNIFPNPASDVLVITLQGKEEVLVEIVGLSGNIMYSQVVPVTGTKEYRIGLDSFDSGIYFVRATEENNFRSSKFIISK